MSESATSIGKIVWFEVPSDDTAKASAFYGKLFGWSFEEFGGPDYRMAGAAGGAVYRDPAARGLMAYFDVEDVDAAAARVRDLGGSAGEKQEIPQTGWFVHCADLDGNKFGLFRAAAS